VEIRVKSVFTDVFKETDVCVYEITSHWAQHNVQILHADR